MSLSGKNASRKANTLRVEVGVLTMLDEKKGLLPSKTSQRQWLRDYTVSIAVLRMVGIRREVRVFKESDLSVPEASFHLLELPDISVEAGLLSLAFICLPHVHGNAADTQFGKFDRGCS